MERITSAENKKIKQLALWQKKNADRRAAGVFLAEGDKLVREAPENLLSELFLSDSFYEKISGDASDPILGLMEKAENATLVPDSLFEKISSMKTPQGILGVFRQPAYGPADLLGGSKAGSAPLLLVLEDVQDPGNVGTIFRAGEGAGVTGIFLTPGCADPLSSKVVRSGMGSLFRIPFVIDEMSNIMEFLKTRKIQSFAAHLKGEASYTELDFRGPSAFLIGNEGNGLKDETTAKADTLLRIPMEGSVESLNAGVSAALLAYEAHRQRHL